jgi:hypothetical protein
VNDKTGTPNHNLVLIDLPTGKPHISFSELKSWKECSFRHKLEYVLKLGVDSPSVHMDFGTAMHSACEHFLKTGKMDSKVFKIKLHELWSLRAADHPKEYTAKSFRQFAKEGLAILPEIPAWFDQQFPGWKFVDAEHYLYEQIDSQPHAFKGFIDCIIEVPDPKTKKLVIWIIDFKTCSWGWQAAKKNDESVKMQIILYKSFWSTKAKFNHKNIKCGFVLLKRSAKPGQHVELVAVSAGDVAMKKSLTVVNNMLSSVNKGIAIKNRYSCQFCVYHATPHCP